MMFRKNIFQKIGLFDPKLGRGTPLETGEEIDMYYRILKKGFKIIYEPNAIVYHRHRQTVSEILKASYTAGLGVSAFIFKHYKDPYMLLCYLGRSINLIISLIFSRKRSNIEKAVIFQELKGWVKGPLYAKHFI